MCEEQGCFKQNSTRVGPPPGRGICKVRPTPYVYYPPVRQPRGKGTNLKPGSTKGVAATSRPRASLGRYVSWRQIICWQQAGPVAAQLDYTSPFSTRATRSSLTSTPSGKFITSKKAQMFFILSRGSLGGPSQAGLTACMALPTRQPSPHPAPIQPCPEI